VHGFLCLWSVSTSTHQLAEQTIAIFNMAGRSNSFSARVTQVQSRLPELDEEQILEFKEAFKLFDKDGGGSIDVEELGDAMRALGSDPDPEELQQMVDEVDEDGSGEIEFDEFLLLMSKQMVATDPNIDLEKAFDIWDDDHDGRITAKQLRYVFSRLPEKPSKEEIDQLIDIADTDRDGMVNLTDVFRMVESYLPQNILEGNQNDDF
jgi:calmodulin